MFMRVCVFDSSTYHQQNIVSFDTQTESQLSLQYPIWQSELRLLVIESKGPIVFSTLYAMD